MNRNNVVLIGYVGKDLISRQVNNGKKKVSIRMATHYQSKNDRGEKKDHTTWHNVVAWQSMAAYAERSFVKGSKILVEGYIDYRIFKNENGRLVRLTEIRALSLMNLDR